VDVHGVQLSAKFWHYVADKKYSEGLFAFRRSEGEEAGGAERQLATTMRIEQG